ncbi:MAG: cytochrome C oxidase subunit IV family protein, partial [Candidatus Binatia bacterium]|nr:cytochrome C oxidase subunit IV family protein [Candidatus Binatia bacterium]
MKSAHLVPLKTYTAVFAGLLGLTLTTTAVSFINLGSLNVVVALTIAFGKALLVLLYFMHVRYSSRRSPGCLPGGRVLLVRDSDHLDHERCAHAQLTAERRSMIDSSAGQALSSSDRASLPRSTG